MAAAGAKPVRSSSNRTLGATVLVIGLFDALQTLLGAVYAWPGGWLTDRWGQRRSLLLFNALSLAGYLLVLVWQHWLALVFGMSLFLAWSALSLPATFAVIAMGIRHTIAESKSGRIDCAVTVKTQYNRANAQVIPTPALSAPSKICSPAVAFLPYPRALSR